MTEHARTSVPLLGRHEERQALDGLLEQVRDGLSGVLVLTGEAGIGKTRLLDHTAEAAADLQIARIVGMESEAQFAYAALHRLIRPFLDRLDRLPDPQRAVLESAFGLAAGPPADRFLAGLATLTLLSDVAAEQPLLCLVDDAQWVDRESIDVFAFVGRRLHADGIGLVLCAREETAVALAGLPALRLAGLAEPDCRLLLASAGDGPLDPRITSWILAETGGNPLALIELVGAPAGAAGPLLSAPVPIGQHLGAHFLRQVRTLPAETQALLLVIAVAQGHDPAVIWQAATGLGLSPQAVDAAVEEGILGHGHELAFRHPLIRSAVHSGAAAHDRRRAHLALAAAIDHDRAPAQRVWHLAEAAVGLDDSVAGQLELVSEQARDRGGYAAQAVFLGRAAELTTDRVQRAGRMLGAARAHVIIGDATLALAKLEQAAPEVDTPIAHAAVQQVRATTDLMLGRAVLVPSTLLDALVKVAPLDERMARDMMFEALMVVSLTRERTVGTTLEEVARTALEIAWTGTGPARAADLVVEALATRIAVGYAESVPLQRAAVAALAGDILMETGTPLAITSYATAEDLWDCRGYRSTTERLVDKARERGALHGLNVALGTLAASKIWDGCFSEAETHYEESHEVARMVGLPVVHAQPVELLAWQGREAETRAAVEVAVGVWGEQFGFMTLALHARSALGLLELSLGNYAAALATTLHSFHADPTGQANRVVGDVVEAGVRAGDLPAAQAAFDRLEERATLAATPWGLGLLARCRALMTDDEAGYVESIDLLGKTLVRTELARSHLLYGEWLRRQKRRADARVQLRIAYDMFTDMGAAGFAERTRVELLATGEQARKRSPHTEHDLTPQEKQVAGLAAAGATNTEIATRLFITTSTVEYHLNKVFRKLGITSRRQLGEAL